MKKIEKILLYFLQCRGSGMRICGEVGRGVHLKLLFTLHIKKITISKEYTSSRRQATFKVVVLVIYERLFNLQDLSYRGVIKTI